MGSMKIKPKICKGRSKAIDYDGCGKERPIYGHGLCLWCYREWKRMEHIKSNKGLAGFKRAISYKRKPTGEKVLFDKLWQDLPHVSFLSGVDLNTFVRTPYFYHMFAHVLSKKQFPDQRLNQDNIIFLSPSEHRMLDQGTIKERKYYVEVMKELGIEVDWDRIEKLKNELLLSINNEF